MIEYQFRVKGSDGKFYLINKGNVRQLLGICAVEDEIACLSSRMDTAEGPDRRERVIRILHDEGSRSEQYLKEMVSKLDWTDFQILENEGKIVNFRSGNHRSMWKLQGAKQ